MFCLSSTMKITEIQYRPTERERKKERKKQTNKLTNKENKTNEIKIWYN
jgi:hypothetical protein